MFLYTHMSLVDTGDLSAVSTISYRRTNHQWTSEERAAKHSHYMTLRYLSRVEHSLVLIVQIRNPTSEFVDSSAMIFDFI